MLASAAVTTMLAVHRVRGTWQRDVDAFIAVSEFLAQKLVEGGFEREQIEVKTNFVDPDPGPRDRAGDTFLFLGRLSEQKGLATVLSAWETLPEDVRIRIVGEGPMDGDARQVASRHASVEVSAAVNHEDVFGELLAAQALIFPSRSYEGGFPMSILEAYACGVPVIASRLGNMAEVVRDGVTGLLFRAGDAADLATKVQWAMAHPEELERMGRLARHAYEAQFTADANYDRLIEIYERALTHREARQPVAQA
jgi:glycosyltransferase involved in cell wall biosynthesis